MDRLCQIAKDKALRRNMPGLSHGCCQERKERQTVLNTPSAKPQRSLEKNRIEKNIESIVRETSFSNIINFTLPKGTLRRGKNTQVLYCDSEAVNDPPLAPNQWIRSCICELAMYSSTSHS
jgi:hypothetical protein